MQGLKNILLEEQKHLEKIISRARAGLECAPDGVLRISKDKKQVRYYMIEDNNETYIPRKNQELPRQLAQKSYDRSVLKKAESRLKQIKRITKDYSDDEIDQLYLTLNQERQRLIMPVEPTYDQVVANWYAKEYKGKEFKEDTPVILTEKGERVRSKSEKILADYLYRKGVLYKYEQPLYLEGYGTVYPDFTFISRKTHQEIFWEHEGRMDDPGYANSAIKKIKSYEDNGIYIGERLILTFETQSTILNSSDIKKNIERYLI